MKSGNDLIAALSVFPAYDDSIRFQNNAVRLMALSDLYPGFSEKHDEHRLKPHKMDIPRHNYLF